MILAVLGEHSRHNKIHGRERRSKAMLYHHKHSGGRLLSTAAALALALSLLMTGFTDVAAQSKAKIGPPPGDGPHVTRTIDGYPMVITIADNTQLGIKYTDPALGLEMSPQFYSDFADGVYMWVQNHGLKVFGPASVPGGHTVNPYTPVSDSLTGSGTPSDPWVATTVNDVTGTKLQLTQRITYVNGAEFVKMDLTIRQIEGTMPEQVTLFHAADLESMGDLTYGYYNPEIGGVGGYYETPTGVRVYQQFVPNADSPATAHQEGRFEEIWNAIGDATAPGPGFNNICMVDEGLDAGMGLQWNLTVPASGAVTVGDTLFFSAHTDPMGSFSDVPYGTFYYDHVYHLATLGILSGYGDTTFRPANNTTRGQLTKMVVLAEGWELYTPPAPSFVDVPADNPFYPYIETAFHHRIIAGYVDDTFRWANDVTRGQLTKIIVLARGWEIDTSDGPHFSDVPYTHPFYTYIETAYNHDVVSGYSDGTFRWSNSATRGQISKIIYQAIQP
jgi:hypothetical protein